MSSGDNSPEIKEESNDKTEPTAEPKENVESKKDDNDKDSDKKADGSKSSSSDDDDDDMDDSISTTDSDDSDKDTPVQKDPELLLIKATTMKEEGNEFFKKKEFEKASRSYRRGVNTLKPLNKGNTGDEQVKALLISLQSNLSMMCFKLEKYKQSSQVATAVLKIDEKNVKALYRRALARRKLAEPEMARNDLREALKIDPSNVAVKKELASIKKYLEEAKKAQKKSLQKAFSKGGGGLYDDKEQEKKRKAEEEKQKKLAEEEARKKRKAQWEDECVQRMAKGDKALSFDEWEKERKEKEDALEKQKKEEEKKRKQAQKKARAAQKAEESDSDDELTERELAALRGYKKTSDGRTTSYFTREQSHEEKKLIGDITPKRLEANQAGEGTPQPLDAGAGKEPGGKRASVWNQAGTWEEKDTTEWCREHLISRLKETKAESGALIGSVKEVKDMSGHASVAMVNGKQRYIFDFHCKVAFELRNAASDSTVAKGTFHLPDICSTHHEELEVNFEGFSKSPSSTGQQGAKDCSLGLASEIRESVKLWVKDFNEKY